MNIDTQKLIEWIEANILIIGRQKSEMIYVNDLKRETLSLSSSKEERDEVNYDLLSNELYSWSDRHIDGDITKQDCDSLVEWFKIKFRPNPSLVDKKEGEVSPTDLELKNLAKTFLFSNEEKLTWYHGAKCGRDLALGISPIIHKPNSGDGEVCHRCFEKFTKASDHECSQEKLDEYFASDRVLDIDKQYQPLTIEQAKNQVARNTTPAFENWDAVLKYYYDGFLGDKLLNTLINEAMELYSKQNKG